MLSDEEKKAIEYFNTETRTEAMHYGAVLVKLIEKKSKEIEELKVINKMQEYRINEMDIPKSVAEQKERKAYIKGTNDAHELCNKKWEDKIKAKIEEYEKALNIILQKDEWIEPGDTIIRNKFIHYIEFGQSLLEKE